MSARAALSQFNPHVLYLSYPFGGYNQRAIPVAQDAGFHLAVTTVQGRVKPGITLYAEAAVYSAHRLDQTMADRIANKPGTVVVQ